jgi:hypothetical protein
VHKEPRKLTSSPVSKTIALKVLAFSRHGEKMVIVMKGYISNFSYGPNFLGKK